MKCAVLGGIVSTKVLIEKLARHGFSEVRVWGYEPADASNVSGWVDLSQPSAEAGFLFTGFRRITECEGALRVFGPDVVFVVGLSQIVPAAMLSIAKLANVGFHPTPLPRGRGRAPVAWLILEQMNGAATFFALRDGVDDGPIYAQVPFSVTEDDDAGTIYRKVLDAEAAALDEWLPRMKAGDLTVVEQDHDRATWFGRRGPEDGLVDWSAPRHDILRLIRASASPHPGAYSFSGDVRVVIEAAILENKKEKGVIGRILSIDENFTFVIQAGDGLVRVTTWRADRDWQPRVGLKLGYDVEAEIFALRNKIRSLQDEVLRLRDQLGFLEREN